MSKGLTTLALLYFITRCYMSYQDILVKNVEFEFNEFKNNQITLGPQKMFENIGKIHFYKEVYTYITEINLNIDLGWRNVKKLADNSNLIALLYDEYLSKEHLSVDNWECIREILDSFLECEEK